MSLSDNQQEFSDLKLLESLFSDSQLENLGSFVDTTPNCINNSTTSITTTTTNVNVNIDVNNNNNNTKKSILMDNIDHLSNNYVIDDILSNPISFDQHNVEIDVPTSTIVSTNNNISSSSNSSSPLCQPPTELTELATATPFPVYDQLQQLQQSSKPMFTVLPTIPIPSSSPSASASTSNAPIIGATPVGAKRTRKRLKLSDKERKLRRLEMNRISAAKTRAKRKVWIENLKTEVITLRDRTESLTDEVNSLRSRLGLACIPQYLNPNKQEQEQEQEQGQEQEQEQEMNQDFCNVNINEDQPKESSISPPPPSSSISIGSKIVSHAKHLKSHVDHHLNERSTSPAASLTLMVVFFAFGLILSSPVYQPITTNNMNSNTNNMSYFDGPSPSSSSSSARVLNSIDNINNNNIISIKCDNGPNHSLEFNASIMNNDSLKQWHGWQAQSFNQQCTITTSA